MAPELPLLPALHGQLALGDLSPRGSVKAALGQANSNAGQNVYLSMNPEWALAEAASLPDRWPEGTARPALYGIPVSLKDCFDLGGFPTSCGSRFYAQHRGIAAADSWVAARLRSRGAVIVGKTHLHQLAYGITGENSDYGDCLQPRNAAWLTGGSSSGAAASVQEGSAVAAIGTDTGGSIRVPAALCGLAGYRSSLGLGQWHGAAHLAPSFDTLGWLFRDLREAPLLGRALLDLEETLPATETGVRIGVAASSFLHDCEPEVLQGFQDFQQFLPAGKTTTIDSTFWEEAFSIFAPIQAQEAARIHHGYFQHFEPPIRERLEWGASLTAAEIEALQHRHVEFRSRMHRLFQDHDFLIVPCAPVCRLEANTDHSKARARILRYTAPASVAGIPVVAISFAGAGVQLMAAHGADAKLLAFAAEIGEKLAHRNGARC